MVFSSFIDSQIDVMHLLALGLVYIELSMENYKAIVSK